jgi:hypothetical protein
MPLVKFAGPTDPRFLATLDKTSSELVADSLVNRCALTGVDAVADGEGIGPPDPRSRAQRRGVGVDPGGRVGHVVAPEPDHVAPVQDDLLSWKRAED